MKFFRRWSKSSDAKKEADSLSVAEAEVHSPATEGSEPDGQMPVEGQASASEPFSDAQLAVPPGATQDAAETTVDALGVEQRSFSQVLDEVAGRDIEPKDTDLDAPTVVEPDVAPHDESSASAPAQAMDAQTSPQPDLQGEPEHPETQQRVDPAPMAADESSESTEQSPFWPQAELVAEDTPKAEPLQGTQSEYVQQPSEPTQHLESLQQPESVQQSEPAQPPEPAQQLEPARETEKASFYQRLKQGLSRTSSQLATGIGNLFLGKKVIDDELLEELESHLLMADVGIDATQRIIGELTAKVSRKELGDGEALMAALKAALLDIIEPCEQPLAIDGTKQPYVILVVGVNGAGKTTTIGKLARKLKNEGKSVMLAAGDTFRAAAVEQLQTWGERNDVPVIAQHTGADSASVIFDAVQAAQARGADVLIADTAGRLQNKAHLMDELAKVVRVMRKLAPEAPHETLLVLDATTGQNAVSQATTFDESVGVTGLALTKLDGTARGGVTFAIAQKLHRPIRFVGVGEGVDDLRPFVAKDFVDALFDK